ncbi:hypothetical protein NL676_018575 [Syzygium grande]|nr:hypothetical protein NL676_018575 [Syzygium grande]
MIFPQLRRAPARKDEPAPPPPARDDKSRGLALAPVGCGGGGEGAGLLGSDLGATLPPGMGNCCRSPAAVAREDVKSNFTGHDHGKRDSSAGRKPGPVTVLAGVPRENIEERYLIDRELGRGSSG